MHAFPHKWGKFILLDHLNSSLIADIFLALQANDLEGKRLVVIKGVRPISENYKEIETLFKIEAQALLAVQSPNVVQVYDIFLDQKVVPPYMLMEHIEGITLRKAMDSHSGILKKVFPIEVALEVAKQISLGLQAAHTCKTPVAGTDGMILHRDVSPQNVILGSNGTVKLIDFCVAKANYLGTHEALTAQLKSKINYVSPEQYEGDKSADPRTDIFSVGVVLWELLAASKYFRSHRMQEPTSLEKFARGLYKQLPLKHMNPLVDNELQDFVASLMARDRNLRPASAAEVVSWIESYQQKNSLGSDSELIEDFLENNFKDSISQERKRIDLLIEACNGPVPSGHHHIRQDPKAERMKRKIYIAKVASLSLLIGFLAFTTVMYFEILFNGVNTMQRSISSTDLHQANMEARLDAFDRENLKRIAQWQSELRRREDEEVIEQWYKSYLWSEKKSHPDFAYETFSRMDTKKRTEILEDLAKFVGDMERTLSASEKIELIKKHEAHIRLLPPFRYRIAK
jgi:serine/threonine protein kinase